MRLLLGGGGTVPYGAYVGGVDELIESMFRACLEAEIAVAADQWLGVFVKCPHGQWRADADRFSTTQALERVAPQFLAAPHPDL